MRKLSKKEMRKRIRKIEQRMAELRRFIGNSNANDQRAYGWQDELNQLIILANFYRGQHKK